MPKSLTNCLLMELEQETSKNIVKSERERKKDRQKERK